MNRLNAGIHPDRHPDDAPFRHREILLTTALVVSAATLGLFAAEPLAQGVEFMFDGLLERGRQVLDAHYAFARS